MKNVKLSDESFEEIVDACAGIIACHTEQPPEAPEEIIEKFKSESDDTREKHLDGLATATAELLSMKTKPRIAADEGPGAALRIEITGRLAAVIRWAAYTNGQTVGSLLKEHLVEFMHHDVNHLFDGFKDTPSCAWLRSRSTVEEVSRA